MRMPVTAGIAAAASDQRDRAGQRQRQHHAAGRRPTHMQ
jgi:hypothetical protein